MHKLTHPHTNTYITRVLSGMEAKQGHADKTETEFNRFKCIFS